MTHPTDALRLVPVSALEEVRDLLMERIHGNPARSAGHNARLAVEAILAAPASPLPEGGGQLSKNLGQLKSGQCSGITGELKGRTVHIVRVSGATFEEQRDAVRRSETYKRGDTVLVWANEGDLYANPYVDFEQLPAAPTGDAK